MPDEPLDPIAALQTIRTLAQVAIEAEPEGETRELEAQRLAEHLRMVLAVCDQALPSKRRGCA